MKTFSSIFILCLAFSFGNAQDIKVHAESDPAVDFNTYKTFTIVDRDLENARMNQDPNRSQSDVTGSGYGSQGATGATEQGTTNQNQQYGTTGDQNNTTNQSTYGTTTDQNNTNNQGTYGTTNDQNRTDDQSTYGTTTDQNRTDDQNTNNTTTDQNNTTNQGTYGTTNNQNRNDESMADMDETDVEADVETDVDAEIEGDDVAGNPEPYEFSDREDRDQGVVTGPENMSSDSHRDEGGSVGTTNTNPSDSENNSTYNNNNTQDNSQSGNVDTTNPNNNNMGNNDRSQSQSGTTNNQNTYSSGKDHDKMSKDHDMNNDPGKKALKEAIKSEMESRGFTYTENDADLVVNYFIFDGETTVSMTGDQGRPGYTAWGPQIGENNSQVELEDGSVIIHLVDTEKNQLVFTAYATGASDEGSLKEDQVQEAVSKIFEEIPEMDK